MRKMIRKKVKAAAAILITKEKHPLCLGDGIDHCDYFSTVECENCKFNSNIKGGKDPRSNCNKLIK